MTKSIFFLLRICYESYGLTLLVKKSSTLLDVFSTHSNITYKFAVAADKEVL